MRALQDKGVRGQRPPRRGAAVVETALVLSLLLVCLLAVFEYGRILMIRQLMQNAAREGARLAVVGTATTPDVTTEQINALMTSLMSGQALEEIAIEIYQADPATGARLGGWDQTPYGGAIVVKLSGTYRPMAPTTLGIIPNPMPMTVVSMMRSEAN
ncbi:MAG: TadE/TadG family type IV pilus assembly protein [Isosphaeraceae bacterium]